MEPLAFLHAATAHEDPNPISVQPLPPISRWLSPVWSGALSIAVALSVISIAPNASAQSLYVGDQGADVSALQRALGSIPIDGVYGPQTEGAVREYQRSRGLVVDGIAGPQTLASLGLVAIGNDGSDDDFFYVRPGDDDFFFVQPQGGPYVVAVPGGSGILSAVSRVSPAARLDESDRGEFVNAGNFPTREAAAREVDRLQAAGIRNVRIDFQP